MRNSRKQSAEPAAIFRAASTRLMGDLREAKKDWSERLLHRVSRDFSSARAMMAPISPDPGINVVGVGVGEKLVDDKPTGVRALKFLVRSKFPEGQMSASHLLPKSVDGLPTDVEEVGLFRRFPATMRRPRRKAAPTAAPTMPDPRQRWRPAQPGSSVGFQDPGGQFVMAGTFGAVVKDDDGVYVLSNNHVLADESRLPIGSPIFQPGLLDGGDPAKDQIASLTRFIKLQPGVMNKVDCAIAEALKTSLVSKDILFIGPPQGASSAAVDMVVHKFGRTTSYRVGRVTSVDTDVTVQYETGAFTFESQIIIVGLNDQPFSDAGDSGSLILERQTQQAVALLFAGSKTHTIANHLQDVLQALDVTLA